MAEEGLASGSNKITSERALAVGGTCTVAAVGAGPGVVVAGAGADAPVDALGVDTLPDGGESAVDAGAGGATAGVLTAPVQAMAASARTLTTPTTIDFFCISYLWSNLDQIGWNVVLLLDAHPVKTVNSPSTNTNGHRG